MKKTDYIIRVLSVAPILAAEMLIILYVTQKNLFGSVFTFGVMLFSLGILPLLAYPLQKYIPKFKDEGRKGQRTLAMLFAVMGYLLCTVILLIVGGTNSEWLICLTYLLSGILLLFINKVFKLPASGHGCGIAGPITLLIWFHSYIATGFGILIAIFSCFSSIRSKRHTLGQFFGGIAVSTFTAMILGFIFL